MIFGTIYKLKLKKCQLISRPYSMGANRGLFFLRAMLKWNLFFQFLCWGLCNFAHISCCMKNWQLVPPKKLSWHIIFFVWIFQWAIYWRAYIILSSVKTGLNQNRVFNHPQPTYTMAGLGYFCSKLICR